MAQALLVPMKDGGIPPGTVAEQPYENGVPLVPVVRIGAAPDPRRDERLMGIARRLETLAQDQVNKKGEIERRWMRNVRAYHGHYDVDIERDLKLSGQSRTYVKLTRAKTIALEARLFDLIFPTDDRNWGIEATPVPKLSKEIRAATEQAKKAADMANDAEAAGDAAGAAALVQEGNSQAQRAQVGQAAIDMIRAAADLMQEEMDDQLTESRYPAESRDMIHDACVLGSGILKGPMVNTSSRGRWLPTEGQDGAKTYQLETAADPRPMVKRVDPWAFFPDMSARRIEEAEFTFERYLWTKKDLRSMVRTHGFNADGVREILKEGRVPTSPVGLSYLTQLRSITGEGDAAINDRYIGWEYHGPLECDEVCDILIAMGRDDEAEIYKAEDDPLKEFRVVVYVCEGQILKIAPEYPLDSGETLYSVFNVEESEGSIFGYGIPEIMSDSQVALNSAWRMELDNAALSVGPQVIVDRSMIEPADGSWNMVPKKVWNRIKSGLAKDAPPLEFFDVPINTASIKEIISMAVQFIDMETGIPLPQQGDQTADQTKTVGGMVILQNAANIIFRRMVKNYDDQVIAPTMRRLYDWNMQHSPRPEIKGDMQIDARGTAVLLLKEIQAQNLMLIVTQLMANPMIQPMLKPYQNVLKLFQSMMIPPADVMVPEEDYKANMAKLAEQPAPKDPSIVNAEARIQAAQIAADSRDRANESNERVAEMRENTAMLGLAQAQGLSLKEIEAQLQALDRKLESNERMKAVEIGVEAERAAMAREEGRPQDLATGEGIG